MRTFKSYPIQSEQEHGNMLKTRYYLLVSSVLIVMLAASSGCSTNPYPQINAADKITGITSITTTTTTAITPDPSFSPSELPEPPYGKVDLSNWKITSEEAIAAASHYVPAEVVSHAKIMAGMHAAGNLKTGESHYYWQVAYMNIEVTKAWLGWQPDSQTTLGPEEKYNELTVDIDAVTGEYVSRRAYYGYFIGGPGMTPPPSTPWVAPTTAKTIIQ
jgi:hypothetical protein